MGDNYISKFCKS